MHPNSTNICMKPGNKVAMLEIMPINLIHNACDACHLKKLGTPKRWSELLLHGSLVSFFSLVSYLLLFQAAVGKNHFG